MGTFVMVVHYFLCIFLVAVILLQTGKGADIGAVFGGASQTVFGSRGPATFLNKLTAIIAIAFLGTSIWLSQLTRQETSESVIERAAIEQKSIPVNPDLVEPDQQQIDEMEKKNGAGK